MNANICPHFGQCGGCTTLDLPYSHQLEQKQKKIQGLFPDFLDKIAPIFASPIIYSYRNKMDFSFAQSKENEKFLGLRKAKSNRVVKLHRCDLAPEWMMQVLECVFDWFVKHALTAYFPPKNRGSLRTLILRESDQDRLAMITISPNQEDQIDAPIWQELIENLQPFSLSSFVLTKQFVQKKVPTFFEQQVLYGKNYLLQKMIVKDKVFEFKIRPQAFFQPNKFTHSLLYEKSLELLKLSSEEILFDLYAGSCALSILAAAQVKQVIAVELNQDAVQDAKDNIQKNLINNIEIHQQDVGNFVSDIKDGIVIIDPPRCGLTPKAIAAILRLKPKKILYISCNPETQSKDIKEFVHAYRLECLQPIDQFPHTPHIENIAFLVRV